MAQDERATERQAKAGIPLVEVIAGVSERSCCSVLSIVLLFIWQALACATDESADFHAASPFRHHRALAIAGVFTIARGSRTEAVVVRVSIREGEAEGQGECVPYARYGETVDGVVATIEEMRTAIEGETPRLALQRMMKPGAARNAVDCALWDLEAKLRDEPLWRMAGLARPQPSRRPIRSASARPKIWRSAHSRPRIGRF